MRFQEVIGLAIEVHRELGPGLLKSTYEKCLAYELSKHDINYVTQMRLPVEYKGLQLDCGYRIDLMVEDRLVVELKSVDSLQPTHEAQLLTYIKLARIKTGLLINFNTGSLSENRLTYFEQA